ncbi:EamA family transporter [Corynebacterium diphtheriae]|uniref:EamA family transporter n=1 Tax=Corynebacterium diphtheriae TaxID=1717 RepID=UPI0002467CED|nr:DMT family transporter [Corynebacterium diphtheriae]AEX76029.1 putative membrane protein [Corynebacterium diphtheriae HC02]AEX82744.1 putative membrane protein [Corynebacterium diphtheriae VA01]MBG9252211.1 DMT family transporter [Corynebacterium diphtheriae bv. mitis]OIR63604.1 multidrug DMT transporter permease [Corynebacterium diphtheriae]OIR65696.1 multidrug DMT transporter permease [Corynebacterium diphtheriae]
MIQRTATTTGVLFIIASCCSLQMGAAFAIQLFPIAGPWATTFARLFISGAILLAITRPSIRDFDRSQWSAIIVFGLTIGAMNTTFYAALSRIPLGTAVTIEFIGPLTLSAVLSKSARDLLWVLIAIAGISLFGWESLFGTGNLDPIGVAFVLIAGFFWAMYILASAKVGRLIPGSGGLALGMLIGSLIPLPLGAVNLPLFFTSSHLIALAIGTAILASLIPYSCEMAALRRLPSAVFGILCSLEPVFAAFFGWLLLHQPISTISVIAMALVITASVGTTINANRKNTPKVSVTLNETT